MTDYVPMKAVLVHAPFSNHRWIFERKLDGIRCGAIPRYLGLRFDKPAREVVREVPVS